MEALEGFVIGLYADVFNAVVSLTNRYVWNLPHHWCMWIVRNWNNLHSDERWPLSRYLFLARLHFSAEELLLYPRRLCPCRRVRPHAKCYSPGASGAYHAPPWRLFFMGATLFGDVYWVIFKNVPMKKLIWAMFNFTVSMATPYS